MKSGVKAGGLMFVAEDKAGDEREEEAAYVNKNLSNDLHIFLP